MNVRRAIMTSIGDAVLPYGYKRIAGIVYDKGVYYDTGIRLTGADTIHFSFEVNESCNVLGCFTSSAASTNYSYYATSVHDGKYIRYNGNSYYSYTQTHKRYDVTISPTGSTGCERNSTWSKKTFTAVSNLYIGTTWTGTEYPYLNGIMYDSIVINLGSGGEINIIPAQTASDDIGYYILEQNRFLYNLGRGTPIRLDYV